MVTLEQIVEDGQWQLFQWRVDLEYEIGCVGDDEEERRILKERYERYSLGEWSCVYFLAGKLSVEELIATLREVQLNAFADKVQAEVDRVKEEGPAAPSYEEVIVGFEAMQVSDLE